MGRKRLIFWAQKKRAARRSLFSDCNREIRFGRAGSNRQNVIRLRRGGYGYRCGSGVSRVEFRGVG